MSPRHTTKDEKNPLINRAHTKDFARIGEDSRTVILQGISHVHAHITKGEKNPSINRAEEAYVVDSTLRLRYSISLLFPGGALS